MASKKAKRKEAKVETTKLEYNTVIKTTIIIVVILAVFYVITGLITGEINFEGEPEPNIQYSEILAGESLSRAEENYLVIYFDSTSDKSTTIQTLLYNYQLVPESLKYYTVDMGKALNEIYKAEANNLMVATASELKISTTAMIEIKDGQVINIWDTEEKVLDYLG